MKKNNWQSFSKGILAICLCGAAFCGICGLGAKFSNIPWLTIAAGICLFVLVVSIIWLLGYMSREVENHQKANVSNEPIPQKVTEPYDYEKDL